MQIYTPAALTKGNLATFLRAMADQPATYTEKIATVVPSTSDKENYSWLGEAPTMSLVEGSVKGSAMSSVSYELENQTYASSLIVSRADVADQKLDQISIRIQQMARVAAQFVNKLLVDKLVSGSSDLCYDGAAMFSATHPDRGSGSTQSNLRTGTGSTTAQTASDINEAIADMLNFKAENGEPYSEEVSRLCIVAPPAMRKPILEAVNAQVISNTSNVMFGNMLVDFIFTGRLTDANDYYVLNTGMPVRPLIVQDREPLEFVAQDSEDSDGAMFREQYAYKCRQRLAVGYANWQTAVKVTNT